MNIYNYIMTEKIHLRTSVAYVIYLENKNIKYDYEQD